MATKTIGAVGLVPKGRWSSTTLYTKLAVVRHDTAIYISKQPNMNIEPGVNANWESFWMVAAADGADVASVTAGTPYTNDDNYTATPITVETESGSTHTFEILAKNGNAGVNIITRTITLTTAGWTGSQNPYSQTVAVTGVTATSLNLITPTTTATSAELETIYNANLQDGGQDEDEITVLCYGDLPNSDITMRVVIVIPSTGGADVETIYETINETEYGGT